MTLSDMTPIPEAEAQVLHRYGVPVLCTAFVGKAQRQYYAFGVSPQQLGHRSPKRIIVNEPIKLTLKKPKFKKQGCKEERVYLAARKVLNNDPTKSMPASELRRAIEKTSKLTTQEVAPAFSRLITRHGLLAVVEDTPSK